MFGASKKKKLAREAKQLRTLILERNPEIEDDDFMARILAGYNVKNKKT